MALCFNLMVKKRTISPKSIISSSSNMKRDFKIPKTESFFSEDIFRECSSAVVDDKPYLLLQSQLPSVLSHGKSCVSYT
ncbi:hypothetical protein Leryth_003224 [Lithospermum erythrorhizon]|nr:hypothetical protein Leryth_003224 [Lithospermum erythrorhizon]